MNERHTAAAYAAGAGAVEIDVVVTNRATGGRTDVGDNDSVIAVTPDDAVALVRPIPSVSHRGGEPVDGVLAGRVPNRTPCEQVVRAQDQD